MALRYVAFLLSKDDQDQLLIRILMIKYRVVYFCQDKAYQTLPEFAPMTS